MSTATLLTIMTIYYSLDLTQYGWNQIYPSRLTTIPLNLLCRVPKEHWKSWWLQEHYFQKVGSILLFLSCIRTGGINIVGGRPSRQRKGFLCISAWYRRLQLLEIKIVFLIFWTHLSISGMPRFTSWKLFLPLKYVFIQQRPICINRQKQLIDNLFHPNSMFNTILQTLKQTRIQRANNQTSNKTTWANLRADKYQQDNAIHGTWHFKQSS